MITFKQYMLCEGIITGLAGSQLGMNNTLNNFPQSPPYGFWVDKSGNWVEVETTHGHLVYARNIIISGYRYKKSRSLDISEADEALYKEKIKGFGYPYRELSNHGFMHLVKAGGTYFYRAGAAGVTPSQRKFLSFLEDTYKIPAEVDNELI